MDKRNFTSLSMILLWTSKHYLTFPANLDWFFPRSYFRVIDPIVIFCVGFPHTLSGAAIFLSLFICIREPSVVTWSLAVRERTLGLRKLYAFRQKNYHRFVSPLSFCFILVKCSWLV